MRFTCDLDAPDRVEDREGEPEEDDLRHYRSDEGWRVLGGVSFLSATDAPALAPARVELADEPYPPTGREADLRLCARWLEGRFPLAFDIYRYEGERGDRLSPWAWCVYCPASYAEFVALSGYLYLGFAWKDALGEGARAIVEVDAEMEVALRWLRVQEA